MRVKLIVIGVMVLILFGFSTRGTAEVNIDIRVSPPPLVIHGPPEVVVIPGTYIYYLPDVEADVFFYQGYWYRPHRGYWFRAVSYSGPWVRIVYASVPRVVIGVPPHFRTMSVYRRIPYRELRSNWRTWERERYWERHGWGRRDFDRGREGHYGVAPGYKGEHGDFRRGEERHDFDRDRDRERDRDKERERD